MMVEHEGLAKTQVAVTAERSALRRYQDVVVGHRRLMGLVYLELCLCFAWVPGALGLMLRQLFWPRLFHSCGRKVYFGSNVTLMHPHRTKIGDRAVISNGCVLDARTPASEVAISLGSDVMLSQGVMLSCKNAHITVGSRVGIGPYTVVQSTHDDPVVIDDDAVIAAHCYIAGGGRYQMDRLDVPIAQQPHPLVTGVDDEIRAGLVEPAPRKPCQLLVEPGVDRTDRRGREAVPAQLLGDRLDLAGGYPLDVHLGERRHQRLLRALVTLEQLGREAAGAVLRHSELQLADPGDQRSGVVARPIAEPLQRPLALLGAQRFGRLGFQELLQHRLHQQPQKVLVRRQQRLHFLKRRPKLASGHGVHPQVTSISPAYHDPAPPALLQNRRSSSEHAASTKWREPDI